MKAIISNMVWLPLRELSPLDQYKLKQDLTIIPRFRSFGKKSADHNPIKLFRIAKSDKQGHGYIGIPRAYFFDVWPSRRDEKVTYEFESRLPEYNLLSSLSNNITLRAEDQEPDVSRFMELHFEQTERNGVSHGIFDAWTSFGKSFCGLEMIRRLRLRAIILFHQTALMDQWGGVIKKVYPDLSVGKVGAGQTDWRGRDIVLATIQTLMQDDLSRLGDGFFKNFGTVLTDEIHRMGGEKFGSVIPKFHAKHFIALSGTVRRADGCEDVFKFVTGNVLVKASELNRPRPIVYVRYTGFTTSARTSQMEKPQLLSLLERSENRSELIAQDIFKSLLAGRSPLIMSERLQVLYKINYYLSEIIKKSGKEFLHGFYIGGKKESELIEASKADVVYATMQLAKEGIDIPRLDTLFLVTFCSDPEQACGRILRKHEAKKQPMVVDYYDKGISKLESSFERRLVLYRSLKWDVVGLRK